ncbi:MAG: VOC family protein [Oligoflexales bacterium]|nr:VOC family protein [Oligoflexales bacterium]
MSFKIKGIHHLGLVPKDVKKAEAFFSKCLNLHHIGSSQVKEQEVNTSIYESHQGEKAAESLNFGSFNRLELLESLTPDGPVGRYLTKKGGGIHHLALEVDDLEAAIASLRSQEIEFVDETPRLGAHETRVAFIHPRSTGGLLIELVENLKP